MGVNFFNCIIGIFHFYSLLGNILFFLFILPFILTIIITFATIIYGYKKYKAEEKFNKKKSIDDYIDATYIVVEDDNEDDKKDSKKT